MIAAALDLVNDIPRKAARMNVLLTLVVALLVVIGVLFIRGVGEQTGGRIEGYWTRQLVWVAAGVAVMLALAALDYEALGRASPWLYLGTVALLLTVLLAGTKVNGARSWLRVAPGVMIQPAEFAKLGVLVALAWFASFPSTDFRRLSHVALAVALTVLPMLLVLAQPDMGSALVFVPICLAVLVAGRMRLRLLVVAAALALVAGPLVYRFVFHPHQKERMLTFVRPLVPPGVYALAVRYSGLPATATKAGAPPRVVDDWNARQSELAVGSGGLHGKGYGQGTQNTLGFLPRRVAPTDFIFSVIAEETGFVGGCVLLGAFTVLLFLCVCIAAKARDDFGRYLACGIAALFAVHVFVNIGMTIRVMPIIGIPLPLVSYGGSGMLLMLAGVGVLQSIHIHRHND